MIKNFDEFLNESNIQDLKDEIRDDIRNKLVKVRKSNKLDDKSLDLMYFSVDKKEEVEWIQFYVDEEFLHNANVIQDLKKIGKDYGCAKEEIDDVKSSIWLNR